MSNLPWGVITILGIGLAGTVYIIYYILKLANEEMKDESRKH
jgi:F0F1-type ATP synthase assembly protein I